MKTEAAFIRTNGIVPLNTVSPVYMNFSLIVHPGHREYKYMLGLHHPFRDSISAVCRVSIDERNYMGHYFLYCLVEFYLMPISFSERLHKRVNVVWRR